MASLHQLLVLAQTRDLENHLADLLDETRYSIKTVIGLQSLDQIYSDALRENQNLVWLLVVEPAMLPVYLTDSTSLPKAEQTHLDIPTLFLLKEDDILALSETLDNLGIKIYDFLCPPYQDFEIKHRIQALIKRWEQGHSHYRLLLDAINIIAKSENLDFGVRELADRMVCGLSVSITCFLLFDVDHETLLIKSASAIPRQIPLSLTPNLGRHYKISDKQILREITSGRDVVVFRREDPSHKNFLSCLEKELGLEESLQTALIVPFKTDFNNLGIGIIGEIRARERQPFTENHIELAKSMATQLSVLIEKLQIQEATRNQMLEVDRRNKLLAALDEASRLIRSEHEETLLLHEIVRLSSELVSAPIGCFFVNHPILSEIELVAIYGLPDSLLNTTFPSDTGIFRAVLEDGDTALLLDRQKISGSEAFVENFKLASMVFVPLEDADFVEAILLVGDQNKARKFNKEDVDILERFGIQASIALRASRFHSRQQRAFAQLSILRKVSDYIQSARDLDKILHVVLTGITAGYGLRFNRAALLLLDQGESELSGRMGIGYLDREQAVQDWREYHRKGLDNFEQYIKTLECGDLVPTPVGINIQNLIVPLEFSPNNPLARVLVSKKPQQLDEREIKQLPEELLQAFQPGAPLVIAPLMTQNEVFGVLVADNKFTQAQISGDDLNSLMAFTNTAAIAIENTQRYEIIQAEAQNRRILQEIGLEISSKSEVIDILYALIGGGKQLFGVDLAVAHLYDELSNSLRSYVVPAEMESLFTRPRRQSGLTMEIVRSEGPVNIPDTLNDPRVNPDVNEVGIRSLVGFPLRVHNKPTGALFLNSVKPNRFGDREIELISILVTQAAVAIENALSTKLMAALVQVSHRLSETFEVDRQLEIIRNFAVEDFNAPMFFIGLHDPMNHTLVFRIAEEFGSRKSIACTSLTNESEWGLAGFVFRKSTTLRWYSSAEKHELMEQLGFQINTFGETSESCFIAPLESGGKNVGVIAIQSNQPDAWGEGELTVFETLARLVAVAVQNSNLFQQTEVGRRRLLAALEASKEITSAINPDRALEAIVQEVCGAMDASRASVIIIDEAGRAIQGASAGYGSNQELASNIRRDGISNKVKKSGKPRFIDNVNRIGESVNPSMIAQGVLSAACLPLSYKGENIGVLWLQYDDYRQFSPDEKNTLLLYANQAAIAYEKARRMEELQHMRKAAEALSGAADLTEVLKQIVQSAVEVLGADSAAVWSYDEHQNKYIPAESIAMGIEEVHWKDFRREEPRENQTAYTVMKRGWVGVTNIRDKKRYPFLGESTRNLLELIGARSFQGVALMLGEETLGILYVNYNHSRRFTEDEQRTAQTYANHAALALKKARLLQEVSRAKNALESVARVMVLEQEIKDKLCTIIEEVQFTAKSDAITLFVYVPATGKLAHPPTMIGVNDERAASRYKEVEQDSIVYKMLRQEAPYYIAEDVHNDSYFKNTRFTKEEGIQSCVALPLVMGDQRVGVMFVNYRAPRRFTSAELASILALANQAAVAIRNAQLYNELHERVAALIAINEAGRSVTGSFVIDDILNQIAKQAYDITGQSGESASVISLVRVEGKQYRFAAAYPPEDLQWICSTLSPQINLESGIEGRIGIIGRVILAGEPQFVEDVRDHPDYLSGHAETHSEIAVPIIYNDEVVGVINAEHPEPGNFDQNDLRDLESLASYAAIAIHNADQYDYLTQIGGFIGNKTALEWIRMVSETWTHGIKREVGTSLGNIKLLRLLTDLQDPVYQEALNRLEASIRKIKEIPITAPLTYEDAIDSVVINKLILAYIEGQWKNYPYNQVPFPCLDLFPNLDKLATVRTSREWLRRALEIIIENAVQAMIKADSPTKQLTIRTSKGIDRIEVSVIDTGPGIPEKYRENLFTEPKKDTDGAGVGLVLAHNIIEAYYGNLSVASTNQNGTEMVISLPIEQ